MYNFFQAFSDQEIAAIGLSIKIATVAVLVGLPPAIGLAWVLSRWSFWGKGILDGCVHLPLVLPPVVVGYALLVVMGKTGVVGQFLWQWFGISLSFNWKGAVLASVIVGLPLMVRSIRHGFDAVDQKLEQAAQTLGAGCWRVFFTISLPLSLPGILSGVVLGFARSLGEFGATITFVSNIPYETQTIPASIFTFMQTPQAEMKAARMCLISLCLSLVAIFCAERMARRQKRYARDSSTPAKE